MKRNTTIRDGLSFDDVLIMPAESNIKLTDVVLKTRLTKGLNINLPLVSAPREDVTESDMAIAMARLGGIGVIHGSMPLGKQVEEVRKVKRIEGNFAANPITVVPETSVAEAVDLMTTYKITALPVIEQPSKKVIGIVTKRDIRYVENYSQPVGELMTKKVVSVKENISLDHAKNVMHENRVEKLVIVDDQQRCVGLMTVRGIERLSNYPNASRDTNKRLLAAAAVTYGKEAFERAAAMTDAGLDALFIDVPHAHNREVVTTVSRIRQQRTSEVQIVVGNVTTVEAARSLIDAGADAIKVGIGASQTSPLRKAGGIGMPQLSAVLEVVEQCEMQGVPVIVDGGVSGSDGIAKALAAGAESIMLSALLAGTEEAPGEVVFRDNRAHKVVAAIAHTRDPAPYCGAVSHMVKHLTSGLQVAMSYAGAKDLADLRNTAEFVRATP